MTETLTSSVADARKDLGDLLSRAHYQNERIIVTKHDKPFATLVSVADKDRLVRLDEEAERHGVSPDDAIVRSVEDKGHLTKLAGMAARLGITPDELLARFEHALSHEKVHTEACESNSEELA